MKGATAGRPVGGRGLRSSRGQVSGQAFWRLLPTIRSERQAVAAEDEGGGYLIEFPDLPCCMSDGATIEEAITNGIDAMRGGITAIRAEGRPIPAPTRSAAA